MPTTPLLIAASLGTAGVGTLGGIGGAVLLVPLLTLTGMSAVEAAPLGLVSVAAASIAAGGPQLRARTVNHRLGVSTEVAATVGATVGALVSGLFTESLLLRGLAVVAFAAAVAMAMEIVGSGGAAARSAGQSAALASTRVGEWPGQIAGVAPARHGQPKPYRARHLPLGLGLMGVSGLVAGVAGAGGGFIKTPVARRVLGIPMRVAAGTMTFTVGVTAAAGLVVFTLQGRLDPTAAAAVVLGSLLGGHLGARLQAHVSSRLLGGGLALTLLAVAFVLWGRA